MTRPASVFLAVLLSSACANILGLDHDYAIQQAQGGAAESAGTSPATAGSVAHMDDAGGAAGADFGTGGSATNPTGGSATNPAGGSATNPAGGSATNPAGGSATNPTGGSATNATGGQAGGTSTTPVRHGTTSISSTSSSRKVDLGGVAPERAFLIFGTRFDSTSSSETEVSGQITSDGKLEFRRLGSKGPEVPIEYYVVQPTAEVHVLRGSTPIDAALTRVALPSSVDLAHSFPIVTFRNSGSVYGLDDHLRAELTGSSELTLEMYQASASGVAEWQVVSWAGATVQARSLSLSALSASVSASLATPVDTTKSWLLLSYQVADIGNGASDLLLRGRLEQKDAVFLRAASGASARLTFYVVSLADGSRVQSGTAAFAPASDTVSSELSRLDPSRSVPLALGLYQRAGSTNYAAEKNPGYASFTLSVESTKLTARRGVTGSVAELAWSVLEVQ